jgi:hypothetical protein
MESGRTVRAILVGGLAVGVLDGLDVLIFSGMRGARPMRIFQTIAGGLIGTPAAFQGGLWTAALGVACHFTVAFGIVTTYWVASRRWPVLAERPWFYGPLYGIAAYLVMTFVVVPLSALSLTLPRPAPLINGLLIHIFGVGLPSAFAARWARGDRGGPLA